MPLVQGMAWTLIVAGWRHLNRGTQFTGQSAGARLRRWWWGKCREYRIEIGGVLMRRG